MWNYRLYVKSKLRDIPNNDFHSSIKKSVYFKYKIQYRTEVKTRDVCYGT